jgi:replication-associated recombination protein RarA
MLTFKDIIGQETALRFLQNAFKAKRIAHAYLFSGPKGTGKKTAALAFARVLNCLFPLSGKEEKVFIDACGNCDSCRKIENGTSTNLLVVKDENNKSLGINLIQEVKKSIKFGSLGKSITIVLIADAEKLTEEAANSLLKILEEPLAGITFILTVNEVNLVPATISSRCQQIFFTHLKIDQIREILVRNFPASEKDLLKILPLASCDLNLAREILENEEEREVFFSLTADFENIGKLESRDILKFTDRIMQYKNMLPQILEVFLNYSYYKKDFFTVDAISQAMKHKQKNVNSGLLLDTMFLQLCQH